MLEKFEKSKEKSEEKYHKFNKMDDYCQRRFGTNSEEHLNCLVITGSIRDDFSPNFCSNRIFTSGLYFNYNLVYKYKCLRDRMGTL